MVEDELGRQMLALLGQLTAACAAADELAQAVEEVFPQHPDAESTPTGTPPPSATYSTGCSAGSTTAPRTAGFDECATFPPSDEALSTAVA